VEPERTACQMPRRVEESSAVVSAVGWQDSGKPEILVERDHADQR